LLNGHTLTKPHAGQTIDHDVGSVTDPVVLPPLTLVAVPEAVIEMAPEADA
jgi:hypothetical protein